MSDQQIKKPTQLSNPTGYYAQSHEMETDFIDMIEKTPISSEELTLFKFNRRLLKFESDDFSEKKFGHRITQNHIEEFLDQLKATNLYDYLELFRSYHKWLMPALFFPFLIAVFATIGLCVAAKSVGGAIGGIFFVFVLLTGIAIWLTHWVIHAFKEDLGMRARNIESFINRVNQNYLEMFGVTWKVGPMAAWLELKDENQQKTNQNANGNFTGHQTIPHKKQATVVQD